VLGFDRANNPIDTTASVVVIGGTEEEYVNGLQAVIDQQERGRRQTRANCVVADVAPDVHADAFGSAPSSALRGRPPFKAVSGPRHVDLLLSAVSASVCS
jgi:hypothetical protein